MKKILFNTFHPLKELHRAKIMLLLMEYRRCGGGINENVDYNCAPRGKAEDVRMLILSLNFKISGI